MSPTNRPFKDSQGKRGTPRNVFRAVSRTNEGKKIVFGPLSSTHIELRIEDRFIRVSKKDGIRLAHWLLDACSTDKT